MKKIRDIDSSICALSKARITLCVFPYYNVLAIKPNANYHQIPGTQETLGPYPQADSCKIGARIAGGIGRLYHRIS